MGKGLARKPLSAKARAAACLGGCKDRVWDPCGHLAWAAKRSENHREISTVPGQSTATPNDAGFGRHATVRSKEDTTMNMSHERKAAVLITGALTGIGRATAFEFARHGARLIVSGARKEAGRALVN